MFCNNCGQKLLDDSEFCDACGYRVDGSQRNPSSAGFGGLNIRSLLLFIGLLILFGFLFYTLYGTLGGSFEEEVSEETSTTTVEERITELQDFHRSTTGSIEDLEEANERLQEQNESLREKIEQQQTVPVSESSSGDLSKSEIESIMSHVVQVVCEGADGVNYGSGIVSKGGTSWTVYTNLHVVLAGDSTFCSVRAPIGVDFVTKDGVGASLESYSDDYWDIDFAILKTSETGKYYDGFPISECHISEISTGDRVTVFGYPAVGGSSQTVTEGIVSGISYTSFGPIYKTSAMVGRGASGGIAISNKNKCSIGIPTWSSVGTFEELGLIQSWDMIRESINF